jgi:hypothetical protein
MTKQTQVPDTGAGHEDSSTADLEAKMAQMQADLEKLQTEKAQVETSLKTSQREAQQHQARADRLAQSLTKKPPAVPPTTPAPAGRVQKPPVQPDTTEMEALAEYANESAKEASLLREVLRRGLSLEDVDGIEFDSPGELQLRLDVIGQRKEIENLKLSLEAQAEARKAAGDLEAESETTSGAKVDTGGPTGNVGDKRVQKADDFRKTAKDLRGQGRYQEATWLALRAAHVDPRTVSPVRPTEEE